MIKWNLMIVLMFLAGLSVQAQREHNYTLFMFNKMMINPAYAGSKEVLSLATHYRNQWLNIEGAPTTFSVAAHSPLFNNRVGAGLSILADKIGILNSYSLNLSYAYRIKINDKATLSIGLSGLLQYGRIDWSQVQALDEDDSKIAAEMDAGLIPNFGLGIYYSHPRYYVGVSIPTVMKSSLYFNHIKTENTRSVNSFYIMGGFLVPINRNVKMRPALLASLNTNAPLDLDLNLSFIFLNRFWVGASYRLGDSVDAIVQFQINSQIKLGLATDITLSELSNYTPGTIEAMLEYNFNFEGTKYDNLRFF